MGVLSLLKNRNQPSAVAIPAVSANRRTAETARTAAANSPNEERANCARSVPRSRLAGYLASLGDALLVEPGVVLAMLSDDDVADWERGELPQEFFTTTAKSLHQRSAMARGIVPDHFTHRAQCDGCGPVWLWTPGHFAGCPWCLVRRDGRPFPQPDTYSGETT